MNAKLLAAAVFKGLWVYSLLAWVYVVASVLDPVTTAYQTFPLSIYVPIPTNLVGVSAFVISWVSFVLWEYLRGDSR